MKPLIDIIPQKTIIVHGRSYLVYSPVYTHGTTRDMCQYLSVALHGNLKKNMIRTYPKIKDPAAKTQAIHQHVMSVLTKFHDMVEKEYRGDSFHYSKLRSKCFRTDASDGTTKVGYRHYTVPGKKQTNVTKHIGKTDRITQADVDRAMSLAAAHQLAMNMSYNELLRARHQAYRAIVDAQVKERDAMLQSSPATESI